MVQAENLKDVRAQSFHKEIQVQDLGLFKKDTAYYELPVIKNLDLIYSEDFVIVLSVVPLFLILILKLFYTLL